MTSAADLFVDTLVDGGLREYFGIPGVDTLPLYAALERRGARSIIVRHEASAAYAADAHFRISARPAACLTTGGPGAANTAAAMGEAWASSSTLLHVSTSVPSSFEDRPPPRGLPHYHPRQRGQFEAVAKWMAHCTNPADLAVIARDSLDQLARPPHAPVFVEIPVDLLEQEIRLRPGQVTPSGPLGLAVAAGMPASPTVDSEQLDEVSEALAAARAPIIWAGSGSLGAAGDLVRLSEMLGAPIVLTYSAKRRFGEISHPQVVPYPPHEPAVADLLAASDIMLAVGTDLDAMMTRQFRVNLPPTLIQIDVEPAHIGMHYPVDIPVVGRAEEVVARVVERLGTPTRPVDAHRAEDTRRRVWSDQATGAFAPARTFLEQLDGVLPEDAIIVTDMAVAGYWAAGYLRLAPRRQLLYPMGWGTLGSGLPAAIGAAVAGAGRRVVCIAGDAGLLYAVGELATVAEHDLPITLILVDDGGYGMLRFAGQARFGREFDMDLRSPDFAALAGAFGIEARVTDIDAEVAVREMRDAVSAPKPSLLVMRGQFEPPRMSRLWE